MILTFKYRIKDKSARKALTRYAFAANQVWNWCVAQQRDVETRYRAGAPKRRWASHFDLTRQCRGVGKELGLHQKSVNNVCEQFVRSRDKAKRCPNFRASNGPKRSLGWVPFQKQSRRVDDNSIIYLGKRYRFWEGNRPVPQAAKGGAFVEDSRGRWYVCFTVEVPELQSGVEAVGIDLGLKTLATLSNGETVPALQHFRLYQTTLATAQRAGNRRRVSAIHAKIANARRDQLHKATTKIARENALIAVGDVSSSKLAKTRMAKSVLDAGWSMFRSQLRYKASRHGAVYLDIDEKFTTQTCSQCGALPPERPKGIAGLGIRVWDCSECGASHDRDVNAAKNILALALSAQRRGDESRSQPDRHAA
jgi:IS605 OrfB family transposase